MTGTIEAPTGAADLPSDPAPAGRTGLEPSPVESWQDSTLHPPPAPDENHQPHGSGLIGTVLGGRYRLDRVVGHGGTAIVYQGTDTMLDRPVAVKVFHPHVDDPLMVARQNREMRLLSAVNHPHLVTVYDAHTRPAAPGPGPDDDRSYLVTEFVHGSALSALLLAGKLPAEQVAVIGLGIAEALEVVHGLGVVHRDVKPGNVLIAESGQVKLADFGIAREVDGEAVTSTNDVIGTAPYLSPEQARGHRVGSPSDIYSLGLVLLECLTGRREFPGTPVQAAVARLLRQPEVPASLPAPWTGLLSAMTTSEPGERPTAADVADELARIVEHPSAREEEAIAPAALPTAPLRGPAVAAESVRPRHWRPLVFGTLLAAAAAAVVVVSVTNGEPELSDTAPVAPVMSAPPTPTTADPVLITVTVAAPEGSASAEDSTAANPPAATEPAADLPAGLQPTVQGVPTPDANATVAADPPTVIPAEPAAPPAAAPVQTPPPDSPADVQGQGNGNSGNVNNGNGNGNGGGDSNSNNNNGNGNAGGKSEDKGK